MVQLLMVTFASFFHNTFTVLVLLSKKFVTLLAYVCRCNIVPLMRVVFVTLAELAVNSAMPIVAQRCWLASS